MNKKINKKISTLALAGLLGFGLLSQPLKVLANQVKEFIGHEKALEIVLADLGVSKEQVEVESNELVVVNPQGLPDKAAQSTETTLTELSYEEEVAQRILTAVNAERAKENLAPLAAANTNLKQAAINRAAELPASYSHTRPNGSAFHTALDEQGIKYLSAAENIAMGTKRAFSPEEIVASWMDSPGHRANIMNPDFTQIGIAYAEDGANSYYAQLFMN